MTIEVSDLVKRYGRHFELRVPSLQVASGETFGLVGNNGAGKTTFLRLLLDLIYADEGNVRLGGRPVAGRDDWKREVGSYLDESFLLDFLTADEYFDFVGATYGMSREDVSKAIDPYRSFFTDRVLGERTRYIRDLSVGNKKKVGLAAALFVRPKLLILDEPFANLDPGSQMRLLRLLRSLNEGHGTTLLISSHDLGHITEACERIAVLEDGHIVRDETTSEETLPDLKAYFELRGEDVDSQASEGAASSAKNRAAKQDGSSGMDAAPALNGTSETNPGMGSTIMSETNPAKAANRTSEMDPAPAPNRTSETDPAAAPNHTSETDPAAAPNRRSETDPAAVPDGTSERPIKG